MKNLEDIHAYKHLCVIEILRFALDDSKKRIKSTEYLNTRIPYPEYFLR